MIDRTLRMRKLESQINKKNIKTLPNYIFGLF